jgi:septal ring factor EnvC (AmiA/AmiB activator)
MPISTMTEVITNLGFPIGLVLIFLVLMVRYINKKDKLTREDTKEQIGILRQENKEDKDIFNKTVCSFNKAISEFQAVNNNMSSIECKLNTIEQDITVIKTKMDK